MSVLSRVVVVGRCVGPWRGVEAFGRSSGEKDSIATRQCDGATGQRRRGDE